MNFHIRYLETMICLLALLFPSALTGTFMNSGFFKKNRVMLFNSFTYLVLAGLCFWTQKLGDIDFDFHIIWYGIAFCIGILCILFELYIGKAAIYVKERIWVKKVRVDDSLGKGTLIVDGFIIFIGAVGEELIFRQVFFNILVNDLGLEIWMFIIISMAVYGLNHIFFSRIAVIQKTGTGLLLAVLYLVSGKHAAITALAHFTQNMALYLYKNYELNNKSKSRTQAAEILSNDE